MPSSSAGTAPTACGASPAGTAPRCALIAVEGPRWSLRRRPAAATRPAPRHAAHLAPAAVLTTALAAAPLPSPPHPQTWDDKAAGVEVVAAPTADGSASYKFEKEGVYW